MRERNQTPLPADRLIERPESVHGLGRTLLGTAVPELTEIAGFRLGRKLGVDADAEMYLGRRTDDGLGDDQQQNVTLKLFRIDAASSQVERELAARSQLAPGLLAALLDVSTLVDGRVAVA
ncbi:MAG: hypothetical protein ABIO33_04480, partial [Leifsonia sp.]